MVKLMELSVSSVGRFRVHERAGPNRWRGTPPEGEPGVRVCLVDGASGEAARARVGFAHPRLVPTLYVEAAPAGLGASAGVPEAAFVVSPEPEGPSLREVVARGGPLAPASAAGLILLLAEPLRALGERGLAYGGVSPDVIFLPGGGFGEPSLGVAGFDADACRLYRPPEASARPGSVDRFGLVGCLWFALRGPAPMPSAPSLRGHSAPPRRGGRGPGRVAREALEALVRRGLSPREGDRYPDWVTLVIEIGAWLERYGATPTAVAGRPPPPRHRVAPSPGASPSAAPSPSPIASLSAAPSPSPAVTGGGALPSRGRPSTGAPGAASPASTTPMASVGGPWAAGAAPTERSPSGVGRRSLRGLVPAALLFAGAFFGIILSWLWQGASPAKASAPTALPLPPVVEAEPAAEAPLDEAAGPEAALTSGVRLSGPLHDASPEALYRCFSSGFLPKAFPFGHDFRPLCADPDAPSGARRIRQALAARGRREGTWAMREWSHYGWYELAVVAALRDRCCGDAPPTRVQPTPPPCGSLNEALGRVGVAANAASEPGLDLAIDDLHQRADCVATEGYAPLYGRSKAVQRWEETSFRMFVRRFRRGAAGAPRGASSGP